MPDKFTIKNQSTRVHNRRTYCGRRPCPSLSQKSNTITRSGTLYLRPFICTSSTLIFFDLSAVLSAGMISIFPLFGLFLPVISVTGGTCLGIRRLGYAQSISLIWIIEVNKTHCDMFNVCWTHPFLMSRRH